MVTRLFSLHHDPMRQAPPAHLTKKETDTGGAKHLSQIPQRFFLERRLELGLPGSRAPPPHHYPVPLVSLQSLLWNRECLPVLCECNNNKNCIIAYMWFHLPEVLGNCRELYWVNLGSAGIHKTHTPLSNISKRHQFTCATSHTHPVSQLALRFWVIFLSPLHRNYEL